MKENIQITNFGGISKMDLEIGPINILIGPQASGKSITAKLLYYFKEFTSEFYKLSELGNGKRQIDEKLKERFRTYFPKDAWPRESFIITYTIGENWIEIGRDKNKSLVLKYSEAYVKLTKKVRKILKSEEDKFASDPKASSSARRRRESKARYSECVSRDIGDVADFNQYFIPAGRSFFANLQSGIFTFLSSNKHLDPFLIEFGSFYENFMLFAYDERLSDSETLKEWDSLLSNVVSGSFFREKEKDFILHADRRKVNLSNASSGQQETLPLLIMLRVLATIRFARTSGLCIYIEEPEAHLFPTAQKQIVNLLARTFNSEHNTYQFIITTHSPYILSSFNNLIEAGKLVRSKPKLKKKVLGIIPESEILDPNSVRASSISSGKHTNIKNKKTGLIGQNILDSVSNDISVEFGKLLDLQF